MFKDLRSIMDDKTTMMLTVSLEDDGMRVCVNRTGTTHVPLILSGTPEELDAGFAEAVRHAYHANTNLQEQLSQFDAEVKAAETAALEAAKAKAAQVAPKKSSAPKPTSTPASGAPKQEKVSPAEQIDSLF